MQNPRAGLGGCVCESSSLHGKGSKARHVSASARCAANPGDEEDPDRGGKAGFAPGGVDGRSQSGHADIQLRRRGLQLAPKCVLQRDGGAMPRNRQRPLFGYGEARIEGEREALPSLPIPARAMLTRRA